MKKAKKRQGKMGKTYKKGCSGCKISLIIEKIPKKTITRPSNLVILLKGDWILNHYNDTDGFLGWLALQPRYHREDLASLTSEEAKTLGRNFQKIYDVLHQYWSENFREDCYKLEKVYFIYFKEHSKHLHFHIIPRIKAFEEFLKDEEGAIIPWDIHRIYAEKNFPDKFVIAKGKNRKQMSVLMKYLKQKLCV